MSKVSLTKKEKCELARRWQNNQDQDARMILISNVLPLIKIEALKYNKNSHTPLFNDYVQEGCIGAMAAANKFDPDRNVYFGTYAWWYVFVTMQKFHASYTGIKIKKQKLRSLFFKLSQFEKYFEREDIPFTNEMISLYANVSIDDVKHCRQYLSHLFFPHSLDAPLQKDSTQAGTFKDTIRSHEQSAEEMVLQAELQRLVQTFVPKLKNEREQYIWEHRITADSPLTLEEIGKNTMLQESEYAK